MIYHSTASNFVLVNARSPTYPYININCLCTGIVVVHSKTYPWVPKTLKLVEHWQRYWHLRYPSPYLYRSSSCTDPYFTK